MMEKYLVFVIAFGVLVCNNICYVQCADQCKTHADCTSRYWPYCCRGTGILGNNDRTCTPGSCLNHYCSSDSDCGDQSMCCRSNRCVNKGCSGCTSNIDCYSTPYSNHVCCKKAFPLNQTICADNCVGQTCNSNNDCAGWRECCRSGKCTNDFRVCRDKCTSNSECNLDQYCCKKKISYLSYLEDNCEQSCVGEFCQTDDDCGASNVCCISNTCVDRGCSGCTNNTDCYSTHVCCKKTFPFDQTVCAANCINQTCNSNNDCAGRNECCRSGKCTNDNTACRDKCTSNSECNLDQYCCKHKKSSYWEDNCAKSCVGEFCRIDDDCGARNVCCISNTCVDRGCSGCTTNANCSTGLYCCKNKQSFSGKFSACSEHCIGKSCSTSDDCGGPGETCNSDRKCAVTCNQNSSTTLPSWLIAVITVSLIVFLIAVGTILVVFWYVKRKQPANATQTVTVPLQDTLHQGAQTFVTQNPAKNSRQSNENHGFDINPSPIYEDPTPSDEVHQDHNQLHNSVYHTLESPETTKDAQLGDNSGQQKYPQINTAQDNDYSHHPPFNPMYQSKR